MLLGKLKALHGLAPLLLRVVLGLIFIAHGFPKLFGGMTRFTATVANLGMPWYMAYVAATAEFVGGIFLVMGLFTRWAALSTASVMGVAVFRVHWDQGLKGYEFPLTLLAGSLALVIWGGGWLSVDKTVLKKDW